MYLHLYIRLSSIHPTFCDTNTNINTNIVYQQYNQPWIPATNKLSIVVLPNDAFSFFQGKENQKQEEWFEPTNLLYRYADHLNRNIGVTGLVLFIPAVVADRYPLLKDFAQKQHIQDMKMPGMMTRRMIEKQQARKNNTSSAEEYPYSWSSCNLPLFHFAKSPCTTTTNTINEIQNKQQMSLNECIKNVVNTTTGFSLDSIKTLLPCFKVLDTICGRQNKDVIISDVNIKGYVLAQSVAQACCDKSKFESFFIKPNKQDELLVPFLATPMLQIMVEQYGLANTVRFIETHYPHWFHFEDEKNGLGNFLTRRVTEWLYAQDGIEQLSLEWFKKYKVYNTEDNNKLPFWLQIPVFEEQIVQMFNTGKYKNQDVIKRLPSSVLMKIKPTNIALDLIITKLWCDCCFNIHPFLSWACEHPMFFDAFQTRHIWGTEWLLSHWVNDLDVVVFLLSKGMDHNVFCKRSDLSEKVCVYLLKEYGGFSNME